MEKEEVRMMKKKGYVLLIVALLSLTLNWLPEIAHAKKESTGVTYTTATTGELMEMFLTYSIQNPYIETTKNSAELMFQTVQLQQSRLKQIIRPNKLPEILKITNLH